VRGRKAAPSAREEMREESRRYGDYRGARVLVLGLARSGIAAARLLAREGARVLGADESPDLGVPDDLEEVEIRLGSFDEPLLEGAREVILSPGIPIDHPIVVSAKRSRIPVLSELELGYRFSKAKIIAVTGTNGKSTTVSMIGQILKEAGFETVVAGNVGLPFCSVVGDLGRSGIFVLEVSSFQLESIVHFRPSVAGLLNLTPDHLDRYADMAEYTAAKSRIIANMGEGDFFFYNALDAWCSSLAGTFGGTSIPFSSGGPVASGVYLEGEDLVLKRGSAEERVMKRAELKVIGLHNVENALASIAAVMPLDVPAEVCRRALSGFEGLSHRMELVADIDGVSYYNDSKATNVEATVMSLRGIDRRVVLIAGGKDKGSDFSLLVPVLEKVKTVITIGEAAQSIEDAIGSAVPKIRAETLEEAVETARRTAAEGDMVLLSPACASFDMFDNFEHRGKVFKNCVRKLEKAAR
jgi:UDP-N-acetylmuramoylalanine--D-glutamate ligase